jgi:pullulanase
LYDTPAFERLFTYDGTDLGCHPSPEETVFRVWTPTASRVEANLFRDAADTYPERVLPLQQDVSGTWLLRVPVDLSGWYYTYNVINGGNLQEVCDPNAIGFSVNGTRALIARPSDANPPGWDSIGHLVPEKPTDAILYEVHVRDFTIHPESGVIHKGKFLGLAETGTHLPDGTKTGLDHLVELGVTHVHLMPVFDFYSIDESRLHENRFNWGYDPHLYNTPEGSYATDPTDGLTRVRELKEMILALKRQGIGVVMDVVYNHTYRSLDSELNKLVPGYFYRTDEAGRFSDGSGCGNETASEGPWSAKPSRIPCSTGPEYKVDGFRFDLMACTTSTP